MAAIGESTEPRLGELTVALELPAAGLAGAVAKRLARWASGDLVARMWAKDPSIWAPGGEPWPPELADRLGWLDLPERALEQAPELAELAEGVRRQGYERVVVLGMGGSSLAPEVFRAVLGGGVGFPVLALLDSTHPDAVAPSQTALALRTGIVSLLLSSGAGMRANCRRPEWSSLAATAGTGPADDDRTAESVELDGELEPRAAAGKQRRVVGRGRERGQEVLHEAPGRRRGHGSGARARTLPLGAEPPVPDPPLVAAVQQPEAVEVPPEPGVLRQPLAGGERALDLGPRSVAEPALQLLGAPPREPHEPALEEDDAGRGDEAPADPVTPPAARGLVEARDGRRALPGLEVRQDFAAQRHVMRAGRSAACRGAPSGALGRRQVEVVEREGERRAAEALDERGQQADQRRLASARRPDDALDDDAARARAPVDEAPC
jgi:hypothetical protein